MAGSFLRNVADSVDIKDIISVYTGSKIDGRKFSCPFHGKDKHPSAVIRDGNRWRCYTCQASGDAIDFVLRYFDLSLEEAAKKINYDFGLGLSKEKLKPEEIWKIKCERIKKAQQAINENVRLKALIRRYRFYHNEIINNAPKTIADLDNLSDSYLEACENIHWVEWELDHFPERIINL